MSYTEVAGGDPILAATINDLIRGTLNRDSGRLVQTVAQTAIVNNTMTPATFTTEDRDTGGYHSTVTNPSRVTPTVPGVFEVKGSISCSGASDYTSIEVVILKNGTATPSAFRMQPGASSQTTVVPVSGDVECNGSTDYFEIAFRLVRSGAGTSGTTVSSQFASTLEWKYSRTRP